MMMGTRREGRKMGNDENTKPCLKNHVNENIFVLFMLEYQIKFSAFDFFFSASFFIFASFLPL